MIWLELGARHSPKAVGGLNRISLIQRQGQHGESHRISSGGPAFLRTCAYPALRVWQVKPVGTWNNLQIDWNTHRRPATSLLGLYSVSYCGHCSLLLEDKLLKGGRATTFLLLCMCPRDWLMAGFFRTACNPVLTARR